MTRRGPCLLVLALLPGVAAAQTNAGSAPAALADFRLGSLWPGGDMRQKPDVGLRLAFYPWAGGTMGRVGVHLTGDYRHFGFVFGHDASSPTRTGRAQTTIGAAVGVDLLRRSRVAVDVRGGLAYGRRHTSFAIPSSLGFVRDPSKEWEDVCAFGGFDECATQHQAVGTVAAGVRLTLADPLYVGLDYTRLVNTHQHLLVGMIGVSVP
jgi:hypothetical protein